MSIFKFILIEWWQTLTKKLTNVLRNHWIIYLLSVDPSSWSVSKEYQSNICCFLPTGIGKSMIFTVYALAKILWELFRSPWQKNTKQLLNWHLLLHCKLAKIFIDNNSRSDWFSKANTLVWAEPCARLAELKILSFWAGSISSFPPCAREYRLLRRLGNRIFAAFDNFFHNFFYEFMKVIFVSNIETILPRFGKNVYSVPCLALPTNFL